MSNHEFELSLFNTDDNLIHELEEILWCSYDDYKEHKLDPRIMSPINKKLIARSILFLNSDLEFNSPKYPSELKKLFSWFTLGFYRYNYQELAKSYQEYGQEYRDENYWPFRSKEELRIEAARPRIGLSLKYAH